MSVHAIDAGRPVLGLVCRPGVLGLSRAAAAVVQFARRLRSGAAQLTLEVPRVESGIAGDRLQVARELSATDLHILGLVAGGWPNVVIGRHVHRSRDGVAERLALINGAIGARNRKHAATLFGLVTARHLPGFSQERPHVSPADADVLVAAVAGSTMREIAGGLGRTYGQVHHARVRLAHAFTARSAAAVAAAAVLLLDAVTARMVDSRFPDAPFGALTAHSRGLAS